MKDFSKYGKLNLSSSKIPADFAIPIEDEKNGPKLLSIVPYAEGAFFERDDEDGVYKDTVFRGSWPLSNQNSEEEFSKEFDHWAAPQLDGVDGEKAKSWDESTRSERIWTICNCVWKLVCLLILLYLFIYSLDILSSAFRLLGGRTAAAVFRDSQLLRNPICGLMIGVLATVLVQSSSTSTSIVVSMVASEILDVRTAIPIIMGANIGTSMTNTLVSVAHSSDRAQFQRAFAGATVHDMFNWLTVIVLLPLEVVSGYLYHVSTAIVKSMNLDGANAEPPQLLSILTKPLTDLTIQLDKSIIENLAMGKLDPANVSSLVKYFCDDPERNATNTDVAQEKTPCRHLFAYFQLSDAAIGVILLIASLSILISCLICIVKLLSSVLRGRLINVVHKTVNAELPGPFGFLTGYAAIVVGALMTILVQSSSVFTSALTPLVGLGVLSIERMYPLTLGSNVGTTFTSVLAAMASPSRTMASALQIAFCHLFFNLSGIALFYPIPCTRRIPIALAKLLGEKTGKYPWFAVLYVLVAFFLLPAAIFGLSTFGNVVLLAVGAPVIAILALVISINVMQRQCPAALPSWLRTWDTLPRWMHSLEPYDRVITACVGTLACGRSTWCCCKSPTTAPREPPSLEASESRRKLVNASTSAINSRAESPARFVARRSMLELIDEKALDAGHFRSVV